MVRCKNVAGAGSGGPVGRREDLDAAAPAAVVLSRVHEQVVAAVDDRLRAGGFEPELVAAQLVGEPSLMVEPDRIEADRDDAGVEARLARSA